MRSPARLMPRGTRHSRVNIFKFKFTLLPLQLKYPDINARMRNQDGRTFIFDDFRRKWLVLTPEEWVRQHVVHYLVNIKGYPASIIALEKTIALNDLSRRYDIVAHDHALKPFLIVECKAPFIRLDNTVIGQALRYNLVVQAPYLMVTNGVSDLVFDSTNHVAELPDYDAIPR